MAADVMRHKPEAAVQGQGGFGHRWRGSLADYLPTFEWAKTYNSDQFNGDVIAEFFNASGLLIAASQRNIFLGLRLRDTACRIAGCHFCTGPGR